MLLGFHTGDQLNDHEEKIFSRYLPDRVGSTLFRIFSYIPFDKTQLFHFLFTLDRVYMGYVQHSFASCDFISRVDHRVSQKLTSETDAVNWILDAWRYRSRLLEES